MISEIVPITPEIADMIVTGATHTEILSRLHSQGLWRSLLEDGIEMLLDGLVDYDSLQGAVDLSNNALNKDLKSEQNDNQTKQVLITASDSILIDNPNTIAQSKVEKKKIDKNSFAQGKARINNQQSHPETQQETNRVNSKTRAGKRKQPVRKAKN